MKTLFNIINQHMMLYETELERKDLLVLVEDYVSSRGWGSESLKVFKDEVRDIYLSKPKNEAFVADKVVQFVRKQALKRAIEDSITILEKSEEYEGVLKLIDKAISIGSGTQETKTIKDLVNLPDVYRARYDPAKLIRTGFSRFDQALLGGMAPGELHCFIGPPGSGKSTFGCNIGAYNIALGKKVFHATMEIKDIDVLKHYALRLTAMSHTSFLTVDNDTWKKKMEKFRKFENNLFVTYWPEKTANALTIRAWVAQHRSSLGINPSLIIVDYDDLLTPVGGSTNDMYEDAGSIYGELIQLADYFKCPVITFAQTRRDAWDLAEGEVIVSQHLAHSAKKAHKAYSVSSLNFKKGAQKGKLYIDKCRRGEDGVFIDMERDLSRSYFGEKSKNTHYDDGESQTEKEKDKKND
jgi:replicative DNA helicase